MTKHILFTILSLVLAACKDQSASSPRIDFGADDGFSHRDGYNLPAGFQDPTDWSTDATWNEQEKALFSDAKIDLNATQIANFLATNWLYPNPAAQSSWLITARKDAAGTAVAFTRLAVLVDNSYQVMYRFPTTEAPGGYLGNTLDYAQLGLQAGERYRLYYLLTNATGLLYKGHGDIRYDKP